jgi:hypothetical protein
MRHVFSCASSLFAAAFVVLLVLALLTFAGPAFADEPLSRPPNDDGCSVPNGDACPAPQPCSSEDPDCCPCEEWNTGDVYCDCMDTNGNGCSIRGLPTC